MGVTLQDAILATRNGDKVGAQKVLVNVLKADTENIHAWYLLALLVDSPEKREAYLNQVLRLDPTHEKAREALGALSVTETSTVQPSHESDAFDSTKFFESEKPVHHQFEEPAQFEMDGDDSILPSWLSDEDGEVTSDMLMEEDPSEIFAADLPDWLGEASPGVIEEPPTLVSENPPHGLDEMLTERGTTAEATAAAISPSQNVTPQQTTAIIPVNRTSNLTNDPETSLRRVNLMLIVVSFLALITLIAFFIALFGSS